MKQRTLFDWTPDVVRQKHGIRSRPRVLLRERSCERCGKDYRPTRKDQRFCNANCRKAGPEYNRAWRLAHRERHTAQVREWQAQNKLRMFDAHLKRTYGITVADFNRMLAEQGGGCGICGTRVGGSKNQGVRLHVDHDHETGEARGLLCGTCNRGIGQLGDDLERVLAAVRYLQRGREKTKKKASESA
jgi:hypothetical protein